MGLNDVCVSPGDFRILFVSFIQIGHFPASAKYQK